MSIKPNGVQEFDGYPMPNPATIPKTSEKEKQELLKKVNENLKNHPQYKK